MRSKNFAAALLVAVSTASALAMSAPAKADPAGGSASSQMDQAFLQALKDNWTSTDRIGHFGGLSVQAYCPKAMPKQ